MSASLNQQVLSAGLFSILTIVYHIHTLINTFENECPYVSRIFLGCVDYMVVWITTDIKKVL